MAVDQDFNDGLVLHQSGQLDAAEACYRRVLAALPEHADALHYLGLIAFQRGDFPVAAEQIQRAIERKRSSGELVPAAFLVNLGSAKKRLGLFPEALQAYQAGLALDSTLGGAWFNLGLLHRSFGNLPAAIDALERACAEAGSLAAAWLELGECHLEQGNDEAALRCFGPLASRAHSGPAEMALRLGKALLRLGRYDAGLSVLEPLQTQGLASVDYLNALGCALSGSGRLGDAERCLTRARAIAPADQRVADNLATVFKDLGRVSEALALYRSVLTSDSEPEIWSNYLFSLLYSDQVNPDEVLAEHHRGVGSTPLASESAPGVVTNVGPAPARLRIAYLSGDMRNHPVAYFLIGILRGHDPSRVDVHVYDNGVITDDWTLRLKKSVSHWHKIRALSDEELARKIRLDDIDVLIDLSGHTAENRLLALASHPARIQASYLGYPFSTGMPWIDWRIVDAITDPPGSEQWSSERLYRLPRSYYAYSPDEGAPPVRGLPALKNRHLTFGACTNLAKVSPTTLDFWASIIRSHPAARLLWRARPFADPKVRKAMSDELRQRGLDSRQVRLVGWAAHADRWAIFHEVDVALDTYPYNQATNTCEALWMGVPTISVTGRTHVSRMGASILAELGLDDWCVDVGEIRNLPERLVGRASELLASDSLAALRAGLRGRVQSSRLVDGKDAARAIEAACETFMNPGQNSPVDPRL